MSTSQKFIFFHIPKNAGSSVRSIISQYCDISSQVLPYTNYLTINNVFHNSVHVKQLNVRSLIEHLNIDLKGYVEFVIVREPLNRLISLYNYNGINQGFKNFYQYAIDVAIGQKNQETRVTRHSQLSWITDPLTDSVKIYKFENLDNDIILNDLHINLNNFQRLNVNTNKKISLETLSEKEIKFCLDFLSEEYETLGYNKP